MPKLIDYPRTSYTGAWELAEITDDTGGKCTIETAARKLNRKVSGSFKAIIGSAVKFGLLSSKRELLSTTTLFKRIKHAYDKQEELAFHREAFLNPPLFTQIYRKFRSRELPVQMLDVMLIREFGVEEINAQGVAKAFVDGCRMVGLLDEHNTIADIDAYSKQPVRQQLSNPTPQIGNFRPNEEKPPADIPAKVEKTNLLETPHVAVEPAIQTDRLIPLTNSPSSFSTKTPQTGSDAIASLFGLLPESPLPAFAKQEPILVTQTPVDPVRIPAQGNALAGAEALHRDEPPQEIPKMEAFSAPIYRIQISGPGINTELSITENEDISLAIALLEKIRRQLKA